MGKSLLFRSIILGFILGISIYGLSRPHIINADFEKQNLSDQYEVKKTVKVVITAYTNISALTDDSPNITASNKQVKYGMVATNIFPFGTKIRIKGIPELEGEIFVVEDRMNRKYNGKLRLDLFLPTYKEAKEFGAKITEIEVLES